MEQFGVLTLGSRLKRLSDYLFAQVQEIYSVTGVPFSATYFPILRLLQMQGNMPVTEIAERLRLSHPAVSKQTVKMLKEGLLDKQLDKADQRLSVLQLSEFGAYAMSKAEPVLLEMQHLLERQLSFSSENFMTALEQLEQNTFSHEMAIQVVDRLVGTQIVKMNSTKHAKAFYHLNMVWLKRYFAEQINAYDLAILERPEEWALQHNGEVFLAVTASNEMIENLAEESVVGAVAIKWHDQQAEILKLAVADHCQGKGIGQKLLEYCIERAKHKGVNKVFLETAACLKAAQHLYEKNGFVTKVAPRSSDYERADVYMEKQLEGKERVQ
ncbi:bifunctional helix-turn-helix transcriptional regulator/GNAT family N-acetyltransferase [Marinomonas sp. THO17]|uniref:bifunctional helix-turn-helix transcriptional regulator/GNAT family N-acetyltransferase n=1 Tax=Marinomonas sp. THO17 TaxID=3149048 RepID=UPI00336BC03B